MNHRKMSEHLSNPGKPCLPVSTMQKILLPADKLPQTNQLLWKAYLHFNGRSWASAPGTKYLFQPPWGCPESCLWIMASLDPAFPVNSLEQTGLSQISNWMETSKNCCLQVSLLPNQKELPTDPRYFIIVNNQLHVFVNTLQFTKHFCTSYCFRST